MPVGDFPTVFPTIMKCWFYRMVTSENGIIHTYRYIYICAVKNICTFTYILDVSKRSVLGTADDDIAFFCIFCHCFWACIFLLIMSMFFANTCIFCIFKLNNTMLHFFLHIMILFIVHGKICLQFTCVFCMFAVHGRHGTVENASIILEF